MQQNIIKFFLKRFISKTPWAFKAVQIILVIATFIVGLPGLLDYMCTNTDVCLLELLPEAWVVVYNKALAITGMILAFLTQFAADPEGSDK